MELDVIIMQIITVIINIYIANTENKKNIYITTFLFNFASLLTYLFNGDKTTVIIYIIISIRSLIYIYKDKLKKYHIIPILCVLAQLVCGFATIENIYQLIPIFTPCIACIYMWYCNTTQSLRIYNALCNFLWFIYNIKTKLYIIGVTRIITVIVNIIAYLKNKKNFKLLKKEVNKNEY